MKNVLVREFLKANTDIKINYVRDIYGHKKGVVVRIGRDKDAKIGWSLVNINDMVIMHRKPHQLPFYQWMKGMGASGDTIYFDPAFQRLLENGGYVKIPKFDKYEGLYWAINRAMSGSLTVEEGIIKDNDGNLPNDEELIDALAEISNWTVLESK